MLGMARILIVDDEHWCRVPLAKLLEFEGYETMTASDGLEAIDALAEKEADLVLLDMMMPRMDGIGFLEAIRRDPRYQDLPVILVTAAHDRKKVAAAMALGVRDYIFKADCPFTRLLGIVQKNLGEVPQEPAKGN
jgi:CheY-like chemotaxis protein